MIYFIGFCDINLLE